MHHQGRGVATAGGDRDRLGVVAGAGGDQPALELAAARPATLLIAPRVLNEPVRCRFSAFSPTGAPIRFEISRAAEHRGRPHLAGDRPCRGLDLGDADSL